MIAIYEEGTWNVLTPSGWVAVGKRLSNILLILQANGLGE